MLNVFKGLQCIAMLSAAMLCYCIPCYAMLCYANIPWQRMSLDASSIINLLYNFVFLSFLLLSLAA